jgi:hypothetical protein
MRTTLVLTAVLAASPHLAPPAAAADTDALGDREVRLRCREGATQCRDGLVGRVLACEPDRLRLSLGRRLDPLSVPLAELERLEVHRGTQLGKGARAGAIIGGTTGVVLGVAAMAGLSDDPDWGTVTAGDYLLMGGVLGAMGAAAGTAVGGLVGVALPRWEPLPDSRLRIGLRPHRRGAALALSVSF